MNKTIIISIAVAIFAAAVGYFLLPDDGQEKIIDSAVKIKSDFEKFSAVICADSNDVTREYFLDLVRNEYPDQKIEDLCDLE